MRFEIRFTPAADRQLRKLERPVQIKVATAIAALSENPRRPGVEKLQGADLYRIKAGRNHRILFEIHDQQIIVVIIKIGDRKDIYR